MADSEYLICNLLRQRYVRICKMMIYRHAVGVGDDCCIVCGFGSALDFQAGDSGADKLGDVLYHAHIAGIEYMRAALVFEYRKILTRALFLHKTVAPAAWLSAVSPVCVPSREVI